MNSDEEPARYQHELFYARCLNDDEFYQQKKHTIKYDIYPWQELTAVAYVLKTKNNSIQEIYKHAGSQVAMYAMELCDKLAEHEINLRWAKYEKWKEEFLSKHGDWTSLEIEYEKKKKVKELDI